MPGQRDYKSSTAGGLKHRRRKGARAAGARTRLPPSALPPEGPRQHWLCLGVCAFMVLAWKDSGR